MPRDAFSHVEYWVFDLDNTLYPPSARLFDQIEVRMTKYVMDALGVSRPDADRIRQEYWHEFGTTLAGLMRIHDVDPAPYLTHVHDIDMSHMQKDEALAKRIGGLPGCKIVYTNGTADYAKRVLAACGLSQPFDAVYGVENADFLPKPEHGAFDVVFAKDGLETIKAAMFEDDHRNLIAPHAMGMKTVHVAEAAIDADHIHHHTDNLSTFLESIV